MARRITKHLWMVGLGAAAMLVLVPNARADANEYEEDASDQPASPTNPLGGPPAAPQPVLLGGERPVANQPLVKITKRPILTFDGGAGILGFLSGAAKIGPVWNARVTGLLTERWGLEANYSGSVATRNSINSPATGTLFMTAIDVDARFNLLRTDQAFVQPYVAAGVGYAGFAGTDGDLFTITVPLAIGAERMLTQHIKVGARFNFRPAFGDNLGFAGQSSPPGGDTWSLLANLGGAF